MSYEEEKQDRKIEQLEAEIERLRREMENYGDDYVCQMKSKDARIQELEAQLALTTSALENATRKPDVIDATGTGNLDFSDTNVVDDLIKNGNGLRARAHKAEARIKELEDALVEERARRRHATERGSSCKYHKECEQEDLNFCDFDGCPHKIDYFMKKACQRLQAEGKIGTGAKPRSWQITEERKAALKRLYGLLVIRYKYSYPDETETLRAMLEEAGQ